MERRTSPEVAARKSVTFVDPAAGPTKAVLHGRPRIDTLVEALAKLQDLGILADNGHAKISVAPMQLPDGSVAASVALIVVVGTAHKCLMMPSCTGFAAKDKSGKSGRYDMDTLDGAVTDAGGRVQLRNGLCVHAVKFEPMRLPLNLTEQQEQILRHTIRFVRADEQCYRRVHETLLPDTVALDYAAVAKLGIQKLPMLKEIENYLAQQMPGLSRQTVADALAFAGLRRPRSGPCAPQRRITTRASGLPQLV
jgi:hypothetical protein